MEISPETHCLLLLKALYGLVQAARQWWKKFKEVMNSIGYVPSPAYPCLFLPQSKDKNSFVIIYVDDGGIFGTKEDVNELIKALSKDFKVKYLGNLEHFVGCHIIENKAKDTMWIYQPKLLKHLKQELQQVHPYYKNLCNSSRTQNNVYASTRRRHFNFN